MSLRNHPDSLHNLFIQNVSHELRTPLAVMLGFTQLLREGDFGELAPEQEQATTVILDRVTGLRTLVERICLLISVEGQEGVFKPTLLSTIVEEEVAKIQARVNKADLMVKLEIAEDVTAVSGDLHHLQQMTECLLDNAIKFSHPGSEIVVQVYSDEGWTYLTVRDSGIGIAENEIKEILANQFYQVDGSTIRNHEGLGLGLTVVKSVVQAHKGQLSIESEPNNGSEFAIQLPIASAIAQEQSKLISPTLQRILVVDDEVNVGLIVQKGLKKLADCEIKLANNAEEALALCEEAPFDLMITDYMMPGTDGIALSSQIHQLYPQTIILMLTAHSNDELLDWVSEGPVQHILNKPVEMVEIRQTVSQALQNTNSSYS